MSCTLYTLLNIKRSRCRQTLLVGLLAIDICETPVNWLISDSCTGSASQIKTKITNSVQVTVVNSGNLPFSRGSAKNIHESFPYNWAGKLDFSAISKLEIQRLSISSIVDHHWVVLRTNKWFINHKSKCWFYQKDTSCKLRSKLLLWTPNCMYWVPVFWRDSRS